jgi:lipopolysaccharide transport protein LptA
MARWSTETLALLACCVAGLGAGIPHGMSAERAAAARTPAPELTWERLEYQPGKVMLRKVVITERDARGREQRIQADQAEAKGVDFDNNDWNFTGAVVVSIPEGELHAAQAVVHFVKGRITTATATGMPATFEQHGAGSATTGSARGHARTITYQVAAGDVTLEGDAWLSDDAREITSPRLVYNVGQRSVVAEGDDGGRVRGTIRSKNRAAAGDAP